MITWVCSRDRGPVKALKLPFVGPLTCDRTPFKWRGVGEFSFQIEGQECFFVESGVGREKNSAKTRVTHCSY